jgi:hypothetical protein
MSRDSVLLPEAFSFPETLLREGNLVSPIYVDNATSEQNRAELEQ